MLCHWRSFKNKVKINSIIYVIGNNNSRTIKQYINNFERVAASVYMKFVSKLLKQNILNIYSLRYHCF